MYPGRVQDPEGAKVITISFNTATGAVATIIKCMFLITYYTEADTGRLRLDAALTTGDTSEARKGDKKILIYDNIMHPLNSLEPSKCGTSITARDRATWAVNTLKLLEQTDGRRRRTKRGYGHQRRSNSPDTYRSNRSERHGNHIKQQEEGTSCTRETTSTLERGFRV